MEDEYWVVGDDTQPFSHGLCVCKMLKFHPQRPTIRPPSRGQLFEILAQNLIFLQKCPAPTPIKVKNKKDDFTCFLPKKYEKMSFFKKKFQNPFFLHIKVPETYTCTSECSDSKWGRLGHFRKKVYDPNPYY